VSERAPQSVEVFFRDDDAGPWVEPLRAVVELLIEEAVPCNYQIVPAHLAAETADYLRSRRQACPELVHLNQHGYRHEHTVGGERSFAEFSGGRSLADQQAAIGRGRELLQARLGEDLGPAVFTPPCHKYDRNTLRALQALGFTVFSAGLQTAPAARAYYALGRGLRRVSFLGKRVSYHGARIPGTTLLELSGAIDVDEECDARGEKIRKSAEDLHAEWQRLEPLGLPVVGVMLHHQNYVDHGKLEALRGFLGYLRRDPRVRFRSLESIAASRGS
jgi:hypothetical protein